MKLTLTIAPINDAGEIGDVTDEVVAVCRNNAPTAKDELNAGIELGETIMAAVQRHHASGVKALDMTLLIDN